jgi:osmotically-inducible protein OsmY
MTMRNGNPLLLAVFLLLAAALAGCVSSSQCTSAECQADARINSDVKSGMKEHRELGPPNTVYVQTRGGVVYLSGQVATDLQRDTAESVADQVPGVVRVVNSIALSYSGR